MGISIFGYQKKRKIKQPKFQSLHCFFGNVSVLHISLASSHCFSLFSFSVSFPSVALIFSFSFPFLSFVDIAPSNYLGFVSRELSANLGSALISYTS